MEFGLRSRMVNTFWGIHRCRQHDPQPWSGTSADFRPVQIPVPVKVKVKQSRSRPVVAQRVPGI